MKVPGFWILSFICLTIFAKSTAEEPRVVCYYTNWSIYRPGNAKYSPQNINPYLCTHLIYAFGGFTKDSTLQPFDKYQDIEKGGYAKFTGLKTYNKNLKTLLAIGGWNEASSRFSPLVGDAERRRKFVKNAVKYLRQNHFDGLDLDWEYPTFRDGGKLKDRENYAQFVQDLREEFDRESSKTGRTRLLLTLAIPAGVDKVDQGYDVVKLNQYLDWFNVLTYDYHDSFEPATNHHAPLYSLEEDDEYNYDAELNIDFSIKHLINAGADRQKLVLGIPTYGRSYTLFNPDATDLGAPTDGPGEPGDATREKGFLAYYEICDHIKSNDDWTVMHPNDNVMGPYIYKEDQWISYDDEKMARKKAQYVAQNGLGGIMFWAIDTDDFRGTCSGKPYPLIEAAKEGLYDALGVKSTDSKTSVVKPATRRGRPTKKPVITNETSNKVKDNFTRRRRPIQKATTQSTESSIVYKSRTTTPEPPTTPDPGSDFKCEEEGFFSHPRDCKKYFWCLDSGPSNLGIVAHQFTCPTGLVFNKQADSCDYARNVACSKSPPTTTTRSPPTTTSKTTTRLSTTQRTTTSRPTTRYSTTTAYDDDDEEYDDDIDETEVERDIEDPKVIKELIDLIKKAGGLDKLEKHLKFSEDNISVLDTTKSGKLATTQATFSKSLYDKVLIRKPENRFVKTENTNKIKSDREVINVTPKVNNTRYSSVYRNSRPSPQNAGLENLGDFDAFLKEKPQYVTIQRQRGTQNANQKLHIDDKSQEDSEEEYSSTTIRSIYQATAQPQYVNIQRTRFTTEPTDVDESETEEIVPNPFSRPIESITPSSQYSTINRGRKPYNRDSAEISLSSNIESGPQYTTITRGRKQYNKESVEVSSSSETETITQNINRLPDTESATQYTTINRRLRPETSDTPEVSSTSEEETTTQYSTINRRRRPDNTNTAKITPSPDIDLTTQYTSINRRRRPEKIDTIDVSTSSETEATPQYSTVNRRRRPDNTNTGEISPVSDTASLRQTSQVSSSVNSRTRYSTISRGTVAPSSEDAQEETKIIDNSEKESKEEIEQPSKRVLLNSNTKYQTITRNQIKTTSFETTAGDTNISRNNTTDQKVDHYTQKEISPSTQSRPSVTPDINNNLIGINLNNTNSELTTKHNQSNYNLTTPTNTINITTSQINTDITHTLTTHHSPNELNDIHENVTEYITTILSSPRPFGFHKSNNNINLSNSTRAPKVSQVEILESNKTISYPINNEQDNLGKTVSKHQESEIKPLLDRSRFRISTSPQSLIDSTRNITVNISEQLPQSKPYFDSRGFRLSTSTSPDSSIDLTQITISNQTQNLTTNLDSTNVTTEGSKIQFSTDRRGFRLNSAIDLDQTNDVKQTTADSSSSVDTGDSRYNFSTDRRGFRISSVTGPNTVTEYEETSISSQTQPKVKPSFDRRGFRISSSLSTENPNLDLELTTVSSRKSIVSFGSNLNTQEQTSGLSGNRQRNRISSSTSSQPIVDLEETTTSTHNLDSNDNLQKTKFQFSSDTRGFRIASSDIQNLNQTRNLTTNSDSNIGLALSSVSNQTTVVSRNPITINLDSNVKTDSSKFQSSFDRRGFRISSVTTENSSIDSTTDLEQTTISSVDSTTYLNSSVATEEANLNQNVVSNQTIIEIQNSTNYLGSNGTAEITFKQSSASSSSSPQTIEDLEQIAISSLSNQENKSTSSTPTSSTEFKQTTISSQTLSEARNLTDNLQASRISTSSSPASIIAVEQGTSPNQILFSRNTTISLKENNTEVSKDQQSRTTINRGRFRGTSATEIPVIGDAEQTTISSPVVSVSRSPTNRTITVSRTSGVITEERELQSSSSDSILEEMTTTSQDLLESQEFTTNLDSNVITEAGFEPTTIPAKGSLESQGSKTILGFSITSKGTNLQSSTSPGTQNLNESRQGFNIYSHSSSNSFTDFEQTTNQETELNSSFDRRGFKVTSPASSDLEQTTISSQTLESTIDVEQSSSPNQILYSRNTTINLRTNNTEVTEEPQTRTTINRRRFRISSATKRPDIVDSEQTTTSSQVEPVSRTPTNRTFTRNRTSSIPAQETKLQSSSLDSIIELELTTTSSPDIPESQESTTNLDSNVITGEYLEPTTISTLVSLESKGSKTNLELSITSKEATMEPSSSSGAQNLNARQGFNISSHSSSSSSTGLEQTTISEQSLLESEELDTNQETKFKSSFDRRGYRIPTSTSSASIVDVEQSNSPNQILFSRNTTSNLRTNNTEITEEPQSRTIINRRRFRVSSTTKRPVNEDSEPTTTSSQVEPIPRSPTNRTITRNRTTIVNTDDTKFQSSSPDSITELEQTTIYRQGLLESQESTTGLESSVITENDLEQTTVTVERSLESQESTTNFESSVTTEESTQNINLEQVVVSNQTVIESRQEFNISASNSPKTISSQTVLRSEDSSTNQETTFKSSSDRRPISSQNFESNISSTITKVPKFKIAIDRRGYRTSTRPAIIDVEQSTSSNQILLSQNTTINLQTNKTEITQEPQSRTIINRRRFRVSSATKRPVIVDSEQTTVSSQIVAVTRKPTNRTITRNRGTRRFFSQPTTETVESFTATPSRRNLTRKYRPVYVENEEPVNYNSLLDRNIRPASLDELSSLTAFDFNRKNYNNRNPSVRRRPRPTVVTTTTTTQDIISISTESEISTESSTTTTKQVPETVTDLASRNNYNRKFRPVTEEKEKVVNYNSLLNRNVRPETLDELSSLTANDFSQNTYNTGNPIVRRRLRPKVVTSTATKEISPTSTELNTSTQDSRVYVRPIPRNQLTRPTTTASTATEEILPNPIETNISDNASSTNAPISLSLSKSFDFGFASSKTNSTVLNTVFESDSSSITKISNENVTFTAEQIVPNDTTIAGNSLNVTTENNLSTNNVTNTAQNLSLSDSIASKTKIRSRVRTVKRLRDPIKHNLNIENTIETTGSTESQSAINFSLSNPNLEKIVNEGFNFQPTDTTVNDGDIFSTTPNTIEADPSTQRRRKFPSRISTTSATLIVESNSNSGSQVSGTTESRLNVNRTFRRRPGTKLVDENVETNAQTNINNQTRSVTRFNARTRRPFKKVEITSDEPDVSSNSEEILPSSTQKVSFNPPRRAYSSRSSTTQATPVDIQLSVENETQDSENISLTAGPRSTSTRPKFKVFNRTFTRKRNEPAENGNTLDDTEVEANSQIDSSIQSTRKYATRFSATQSNTETESRVSGNINTSKVPKFRIRSSTRNNTSNEPENDDVNSSENISTPKSNLQQNNSSIVVRRKLVSRFSTTPASINIQSEGILPLGDEDFDSTTLNTQTSVENKTEVSDTTTVTTSEPSSTEELVPNITQDPLIKRRRRIKIIKGAVTKRPVIDSSENITQNNTSISSSETLNIESNNETVKPYPNLEINGQDEENLPLDETGLEFNAQKVATSEENITKIVTGETIKETEGHDFENRISTSAPRFKVLSRLSTRRPENNLSLGDEKIQPNSQNDTSSQTQRRYVSRKATAQLNTETESRVSGNINSRNTAGYRVRTFTRRPIVQSTARTNGPDEKEEENETPDSKEVESNLQSDSSTSTRRTFRPRISTTPSSTSRFKVNRTYTRKLPNSSDDDNNSEEISRLDNEENELNNQLDNSTQSRRKYVSGNSSNSESENRVSSNVNTSSRSRYKIRQFTRKPVTQPPTTSVEPDNANPKENISSENEEVESKSDSSSTTRRTFRPRISTTLVTVNETELDQTINSKTESRFKVFNRTGKPTQFIINSDGTDDRNDLDSNSHITETTTEVVIQLTTSSNEIDVDDINTEENISTENNELDTTTQLDSITTLSSIENELEGELADSENINSTDSDVENESENHSSNTNSPTVSGYIDNESDVESANPSETTSASNEYLESSTEPELLSPTRKSFTRSTIAPNYNIQSKESENRGSENINSLKLNLANRTRKPFGKPEINSNLTDDENLPNSEEHVDVEEVELNTQIDATTERRKYISRITTTAAPPPLRFKGFQRPGTVKSVTATDTNGAGEGDNSEENLSLTGEEVETNAKTSSKASTRRPFTRVRLTENQQNIESNNQRDSNSQTERKYISRISETLSNTETEGNINTAKYGIVNRTRKPLTRPVTNANESDGDDNLEENVASDDDDLSTELNSGNINSSNLRYKTFDRTSKRKQFTRPGINQNKPEDIEDSENHEELESNSQISSNSQTSTFQSNSETETRFSGNNNLPNAPRYGVINRTRKPLTRPVTNANESDGDDNLEENVASGDDDISTESNSGNINSSNLRYKTFDRTSTRKPFTRPGINQNDPEDIEDSENQEELESNSQISSNSQTSTFQSNSETETRFSGNNNLPNAPRYGVINRTRKPLTRPVANANESDGDDNLEENVASGDDDISTESNSGNINSSNLRYKTFDRTSTRKPFTRPGINQNDPEDIEDSENHEELESNSQISSNSQRSTFQSNSETETRFSGNINLPNAPKYGVINRTRKPLTNPIINDNGSDDGDSSEGNVDLYDDEDESNDEIENVNLPIPRYQTFDRTSTRKPFTRLQINANEPDDVEHQEDSEEYGSDSQTGRNHVSRLSITQSQSETETRISGNNNLLNAPRYGVINRTRKPFTRPEINVNTPDGGDNSEENSYLDKTEEAKSNSPNIPTIPIRKKFVPRVSNSPTNLNIQSNYNSESRGNVPRFRGVSARPSPNLVVHDGNEDDDVENHDSYEANLASDIEEVNSFNKFDTSTQSIRKFKPRITENSDKFSTQTSSESSLPPGYRNKAIFQRKPYTRPIYVNEPSDNSEESITEKSDDSESSTDRNLNNDDDSIEGTTQHESEILSILNNNLTQTIHSYEYNNSYSEQTNSSVIETLTSHIVRSENETQRESEQSRNELDAGLVTNKEFISYNTPATRTSTASPKVINRPYSKTQNNFSKQQTTHITGSQNSPVQSIKIDSSKYIPLHLRQQNSFNKNGVLTIPPPKLGYDEAETTTGSISYTEYTNIPHSTTLDTSTPIISTIEDTNLFSTLISQESTTTFAGEGVDKVTEISINPLKKLKPTTTSKPTTLHHIFAVDYDSAEDDRNNGTNLGGNSSEVNDNNDSGTNSDASAEEISQRLEKLVEINRIVEIYSKQQSNGRNHLSANSNELILEKIPTIDKIGEISRWISVKLQNHNITNNISSSSNNTNTFNEFLHNITQLASLNSTAANSTFDSKMVFNVETSTIPLEGLFDKKKKNLNDNEVIDYQNTKLPPLLLQPQPQPEPPIYDINPINLNSFAGSTSFNAAAATIPSHNYVQQLRPESHEANPLVISIANLDQVVLSKIDKNDKKNSLPSINGATESSNQLTFSSISDLTN